MSETRMIDFAKIVSLIPDGGRATLTLCKTGGLIVVSYKPTYEFKKNSKSDIGSKDDSIKFAPVVLKGTVEDLNEQFEEGLKMIGGKHKCLAEQLKENLAVIDKQTADAKKKSEEAAAKAAQAKKPVAKTTSVQAPKAAESDRAADKPTPCIDLFSCSASAVEEKAPSAEDNAGQEDTAASNNVAQDGGKEEPAAAAA
ncbi:MAG: hypothetical protein C0402_05560 [Thermodesulfovibrio sp.]|nr:hypothetical protein [Thermodesulfovibrio sp.]